LTKTQQTQQTQHTQPQTQQQRDERADYEVVVIGGGPAGLQAALTLGRVHRRTLLLDSGDYRNGPAEHMHNFLGFDGMPPGELRAAARKNLEAYETVEVRDVCAERTSPDGDGFRITLADGDSVRARGIILATGLRDTLPEKPGLGELWGSVVAQCPFCHGHEMAGRPVAILGAEESGAHLAGIMMPVAGGLTALADGDDVDDAMPDGVRIRREPVTGFARTDDGVRVRFAEGDDEEYAGVLVTTGFTQAAPFAEQLDLKVLDSGCVEIDGMGRTSVPGVHAAGDMAHTATEAMPVASVLTAAGSGLVAASAMTAYLL